MPDLRDGFRDIVSGWMLVDDFDALTDRIESAAEWTERNGPLTDDEAATIRMMIETQVAMSIKRGDFEPYIRGG
jgi:hypothetical protein